jgi:flagellar biosynthesis protein FlhF
MNIRTFLANTPQEALKIVKEALGPDAVILRTRKAPSSGGPRAASGGLLEVTAAVDFESVLPASSAGGPSPECPSPDPWARLQSELHDIKTLLWSAEAGGRLSPEVSLDPKLRDRYVHFRNFGLNAEAMAVLMRPACADGPNRPEDRHRLRQSLFDLLHRIRIHGQSDARIHAFVGPTGVGKTTTLAKLAARKAVREKKRVALVTVDTFRIAAVAQLETYARIMGVPLAVAVNREELRQALSKYRHCDLIFIDTAGRSPNNPQEIAHLASVLDVGEEIHTYLLVSAATRFRELANAERRFGVLPLKSYIITKLDEATDFSSVINLLIARPRPLSYFTTGQRVPEDIEAATPRRLATMILGRIGGWTSHSQFEVTRHGPSESAETYG